MSNTNKIIRLAADLKNGVYRETMILHRVYAYKYLNYFNHLDSNLLNLANDGIYLAGGSLRSIFDKTSVDDYDFFFENPSIVSYAKKYLKEAGYDLVFECTAGELFTYKKNDIKVQLVCKRYYDNVLDLMYTFDFTVCHFALHNGNLFFTKNAIKAAREKRIEINSITYPIASLRRLQKYIQKGYTINNKESFLFVRYINEENQQFYNGISLIY